MPSLEPREGLPPCLEMVLFDGRIATKVDGAVDCPHKHHAKRFAISAGVVLGREDTANNSHGFRLWKTTNLLEVLTDDPTEAEATYEQAERWVRTGEFGG